MGRVNSGQPALCAPPELLDYLHYAELCREAISTVAKTSFQMGKCSEFIFGPFGAAYEIGVGHRAWQVRGRNLLEQCRVDAGNANGKVAVITTIYHKANDTATSMSQL